MSNDNTFTHFDNCFHESVLHNFHFSSHSILRMLHMDSFVLSELFIPRNLLYFRPVFLSLQIPTKLHFSTN